MYSTCFKAESRGRGPSFFSDMLFAKFGMLILYNRFLYALLLDNVNSFPNDARSDIPKYRFFFYVYSL